MIETAHPRTRVIVVGNEKGGTGKTTVALHIAVGLMREGFATGTIDLDSHQASLTRYVENRRNFVESRGVRLPLPDHLHFKPSIFETNADARTDERERLNGLVAQLAADHDYIVIDCAGSDSFIARHALCLADILLTPVNDSFVDIDLLAKVGGTPPRVLGPSVYSQIVWEQKQERARLSGRSMEWIVLRNRLSPLDSRNKRHVGLTLEQLSSRIGFKLADGFNERVIFRQLFLQGLTVLDLRDEGAAMPMSLSHVAARQEIRNLMAMIRAASPGTKLREGAARLPTNDPPPARVVGEPAKT